MTSLRRFFFSNRARRSAALLTILLAPYASRADVAPTLPTATPNIATGHEAAAIAALDATKLSRGDLSAEAYAFKQTVYRLHVARGMASGRPRIYDLPPEQLAVIAGTEVTMRSDAAHHLGQLLKAARADLARDLALTPANAAEVQRQNRARRVRELAVNNAYRSASRQFGLWNRYFDGYYAATQAKRRELPGGEHGSAAADFLREYTGIRVAAPGFSNHQNGIAVDFALLLLPETAQKETPEKLGASMAQTDKWRDSWFWNWLKSRAGEFGFVEYEPEAWHWEYKPAQAAKEMGQAVK